MTVKEKFMRLFNYATNNQIEGTFMTHLELMELQQQSYNNSTDGTPHDVVALFGMNAIESSSDLCRRIMAINNPEHRGAITLRCWRVLNVDQVDY